MPIPPVSQDGLTSDGYVYCLVDRYLGKWIQQYCPPLLEANASISSSSVVRAAEQVIRNVVEAYSDPNKTFDETRKRIESGELRNPLREFTEACKEELRAMRG